MVYGYGRSPLRTPGYEHIARTPESFDRIRHYIINTPADWGKDKFSPAQSPPARLPAVSAHWRRRTLRNNMAKNLSFPALVKTGIIAQVCFSKVATMTDANFISQPFTKTQLELLQLFAFDVPDEQYEVLKRILIRFKAEVLMDKADQIWEEKGWTDEDIRKMLQTKMRTPYHKSPSE